MVVAVSCVLLLSVIFVIEVLTPDDVVAAFAILPLAAGVWTLSGRFAALVLGATVLLFVGAALIETTNRLTLSLVGVPILAVGVIARLYAAKVRLAPAAPTAPPDDGRQPIAALMRREDDGRQPLATLTRRELEVARLAASAYTAAEIGHRLHIGERTVESHLASTYLKLGITSRSQLIRMAERLQ
jgi:DNA-binding CsgD family transcriptional regulator